MNFLQICKYCNSHAGLQGELHSVAGQADYQQTLIGFVQTAYRDILRHRDNWDFMQKTDTLYTVPGPNIFTIDDLGANLVVFYNNSAIQEHRLMAWFTTDHSTGKPTDYCRTATKTIQTNDVDGVYALKVVYHRDLHNLVNNFDIPLIPDRFHDVLCWKALIRIGRYFGNSGVTSEARIEYAIGMQKLMKDQVPAEELIPASQQPTNTPFFV